MRLHAKGNGQYRQAVRDERTRRVRCGRRVARRAVRGRGSRRRGQGGGGDQSGAAARGARAMKRATQRPNFETEPTAIRVPADIRSVALTIIATLAVVVALKY